MSLEQNKRIMRRFFEEAWNNHDLSVVDETFASDNPHHTPASLKAMITHWRDAIPDYHMVIEDMVAEGDRVVTRLRFTGTHTAAALQISGRTAMPKNKSFNETEMVMTRHGGNGMVIETWANWDRLSFLEQLGALS